MEDEEENSSEAEENSSDEEDDETESEFEEKPQKPKSKSCLNNRASKSTKTNAPNVDLLLDLGDLSLNDSTTMTNSQVLLPMVPTSIISDSNLSKAPFRFLESAEQLSFKEFSLVEQAYNFKASYRFPRINEQVRTLVELIIKNELPEESETHINRVQLQVPDSVHFKSLEVSSLKFGIHFEIDTIIIYILDAR